MEQDEDFVAALLTRASRKKISEDFEVKMMKRIRSKHFFKQEIRSTLKKSRLFFLLAILLVVNYSVITILNKSNHGQTLYLVLTLFVAIITFTMFSSSYNRLLKSFKT